MKKDKKKKPSVPGKRSAHGKLRLWRRLPLGRAQVYRNACSYQKVQIDARRPISRPIPVCGDDMTAAEEIAAAIYVV